MSKINLSLWKIPEYRSVIEQEEAAEKHLDDLISQIRYIKYADNKMADLSVTEAKDFFSEALFSFCLLREMRKKALIEVSSTGLPQASAKDDFFDVPGGAA